MNYLLGALRLETCQIKINFFRQAPTGDCPFFQSPNGKMWSAKSVNKSFCSKTQTKNFRHQMFCVTVKFFKSTLYLLLSLPFVKKCTRWKNCCLVLCSMSRTIFLLRSVKMTEGSPCFSHQVTTVQNLSFQCQNLCQMQR